MASALSSDDPSIELAVPHPAGHWGGDPSASNEALEYLSYIFGEADRDGRIARKLIAEFGTISAAIQATALRRDRVLGPDASACLVAFGAAMRAALAEEVRTGPVLGNGRALVNYLATDLSARPNERFRAIFLDARNHLIADELMSEGTVDQTAVYVREIIRRALELGAVALILAHNHPSGDTSPSRADIEITRAIASAGKPLGIAVHDHMIFGRGGAYSSMRSAGLL